MSNTWWSVVCMIGFWGWVLAVIGMILKAFGSRGVLRNRVFARWGGAVCLFYCVWIVAMLHA